MSVRQISWVICISLTIVVETAADDTATDSPKEVLSNAGLRRVGSYYILAGEKQLSDALDALKPLESKINRAIRIQAQYERHVAGLKQALAVAIEQRRRLSMQNSHFDNIYDYDDYRAKLDELTDRINGLRLQIDNDDLADRVRGEVARVRDEYTQAVLAARKDAEQTRVLYDELSKDSKIAAAIDTLSEDTGRSYKLGPRKFFQKKIEQLAKYEEAVRIDVIPLRHGDGGVYWVDVVFDNDVVKPMCLDTGAAMVTLSADFAKELGLVPTESDPVVNLTVADGSVHKARRMTIPKMRLGRFEATAVPCLVHASDVTDAPPLLGQSFLSNFTYEMNAAAGTVTLTELNTTDH